MSKKSTSIGVGKKVLASALSAAMVVAFAPAVDAAAGTDDAVAYAENASVANDVKTITASSHELSSGTYVLQEDVTINSVQNSATTWSSQELTGQLVIPEGQVVTIDLNGHKLISTYEGISILNCGTLTVKDSSAVNGSKGSGLIYNNNTKQISWYGHDAIRNLGTLTVESGHIGDSDLEEGNANTEMTAGAAVRNLGTATINGGYFTCADNYYTTLKGETNNDGFSYAIRNDGTMTINGGKVYGSMNGGIAADSGVVTINDVEVDVFGSTSYACLAASKGTGSFVVHGGLFKKRGNENPILNYFSGMPSWDATDNLEENGYAIDGGTYIANDSEVEIVPVVEVAGKKYGSLEAAVDAAQPGDTVKLLSDVDLGKATLVIGSDQNIVLDFGDRELKSSKTAILNNGVLTVRGGSGSIESTGNVGIGVGDNSTTTIESGNIEGREGAVITGYATGATITINGGTFSASDNAVIAGNGNPTDGNKVERVNPNTIIINDGTFNGGITSSGYVACGIYAPWKDTVNVNGGTFNITGGAGIVARAGHVNIAGGTFKTTGNSEGWVGDKKASIPCSALVFEDKPQSYPAVDESSIIEVSGGVFESEVSAITELLPEGDKAGKRISVSGGTFSVDPSAYLASGYSTYKSGKNWVVYYPSPTPAPTPEPEPEPTPVAPGTDVSGTDASGNAVDATVTDNTEVMLPDGTKADGSVEYKGTTSAGGTAEPATEVSVPSTVTTSDGSTYVVTKIADEAFEGQGQLTKVAIPETVVEIGERAFANTSIESVVIPAATTTIGAGVFQGCDDLKSVDISKAAITEIPADAFNGTSIGAIEIPATVTAVGARAFKGTALTAVELPKAVKEIAKSTFENCASLKSVTTSATTVGYKALAGCTALKSVDLSKATELGKYAMKGDSKLKTVSTGTKLKAIGYKALAGTKVKTLTVSSKKLTPASVKGSLKGSAVKKVEVAVSGSKKTVNKYVAKYKRAFKKSNSGKSVTVVAKKAK